MRRFWWICCCWIGWIPAVADNLSLDLHWQEPCAATRGDSIVYRPCFDNDLDIDGLPYFHYGIDGQGQADILLTEAVFEPCTPAEAGLLKEHPIADTVLVRQYNSAERGRRRIEVQLLPIRCCDGRYERLVSGKLTINPPASLRDGLRANVYNQHSLLHSGRWVKIAVRQNGMHALTYSDLRAMGFENPAAVRVFGYGGRPVDNDFNKVFPRMRDDLVETPTLTTVNTAGEQQLVFYAEGPVKVEFDPIAMFYRRKSNPYSDYGCYFLTTDAGTGLQVETAPAVDAVISADIFRTYVCRLYEDDRFNLLSSGQDFLGDKFSIEAASHTYNFQFRHRVDNQLKLYIRAAGISKTNTWFDLNAGGTTTTDALYINPLVSGFSAMTGTVNGDYPDNGSDAVSIRLDYKPATAGDIAYLDYILAAAKCDLRLPPDGQVEIFMPSIYPVGCYARYNIAGANGRTQVWDITDPERLRRMTGSLDGQLLQFTDLHDYDHSRTYIAFDPASTMLYKPTYIAEVPNQDLHGLGQTDMVILSPTAYLPEANRLAGFHRNHDGLSVAVVTPEQAYNEFTSGTPDPTAYRLLMKMLYDRAGGDPDRMPRSLLLAGVSTYDNRGRVLPKQEILSYQGEESFKTDITFSTDDYFGFLDDTEGYNFNRDKLDIAVGRLPVYSLDELRTVVDKIIAYANNTNYGTWRNQLVFMGDDGDTGLHMKQANAFSDMLANFNNGYQHTKILLDAYPEVQSASGGSFPVAREKVLGALGSGALLFTYVGHSSTNTLTAEQTINRNDILNMYNAEMAFWITASCEFSRFDDGKVSAGMQVLTTPHAGIGLISSGRVVYSESNNRLIRQIGQYLLPMPGDEPLTIGEIYRRGKVDYGENDNKLRFFLLCDPELTLNYPRQTVITDSINHQTPDNAQMQALGLITVKGHVETNSGEIDSDFDGTVNVTVYDKAEQLTTLGNGDNPPIDYIDYPDILFKGNAQVTAGTFEFSFMVPKDISYRVDKGRMVYYAADPGRNTDANGYDQDFSVGGTDPDAVFSDDGPQLRIYLNSPDFVDGQTVDDTPVFYAHTYDNYGINAVGAGIGHDITLKLNNDNRYSYVLNDFYESDLGNYRSGRVRYQLPQLPDGKYRLDFKVWNLQNVSTGRSLDFVVDKKCKPAIGQFYCTPNPASDEVWMVYTYDRPNEPVEAEFTVYNLHGQLCWQYSTTEFSEGKVMVRWDLNAEDAQGLDSGIYPTKLKITTKEGAICYKTLKLVLHRH